VKKAPFGVNVMTFRQAFSCHKITQRILARFSFLFSVFNFELPWLKKVFKNVSRTFPTSSKANKLCEVAVRTLALVRSKLMSAPSDEVGETSLFFFFVPPFVSLERDLKMFFFLILLSLLNNSQENPLQHAFFWDHELFGVFLIFLGFQTNSCIYREHTKMKGKKKI
jgi:hypothetical protein